MKYKRIKVYPYDTLLHIGYTLYFSEEITESYYKDMVEYYHHNSRGLVEDYQLQYTSMIGCMISSVIFDYLSKGKTPTEEQILNQIRYSKEYIIVDEEDGIKVSISDIPRLENYQFSIDYNLKYYYEDDE